MFNVSKNGDMTITRGDTGIVPLTIYVSVNEDLAPLPIEEGHIIRFFVFRSNNIDVENSLIKKEFTYADLDEDGRAIIRIENEDTLYMNEGRYDYQVKVYREDDIFTVLKGDFYVEN